MGVVKFLRNVLLVVIVLAMIGFAVLNPAQQIDLDLWLLGKWTEVPLVAALFLAFLIGTAVGLLFMVVTVIELRGRLHDARKSGRRLEGELTSLRNLPLEETDDLPAVGRDS